MLTSGQSTSDEVKKLLTANTDRALADGAFGMPYFVGKWDESWSRRVIQVSVTG